MLRLFAIPFLVLPADRIVLKNGGVLEGTILGETADDLEIRIGEGQVVGLSKRDVREIRREPPSAGGTGAAAKPEADAVAPSEEWFLVEGREGRTVGWMRSLVRPAGETPGSGFLLEEEWTFREPEGDLRLSWVEKVGVDLSPHELLYREEGAGAARVVLATIEKEGLWVELSVGEEKRRFRAPWATSSRFPLLARVLLRRWTLQRSGEATLEVFSPSALCVESRVFCYGEKRTVPWGEEETAVLVIRERTGMGVSEEWLDPRRGTLRRECNGTDLVVRRVSSSEVESWRRGESKPSEPQAILDPMGRYRLFLPDPRWKALPGQEPGTLLLQEGDEPPSSALFFLDAPADLRDLSSGLSTLERRLREGLAGFDRPSSSLERTFSGAPALEFGFSFLEGSERRAGRALLVAAGEQLLVFVRSFSSRDPASVPAEWERFVSRLELRR